MPRRADHARPRPRHRGSVVRCAAALLVLLASTAYVTRDLGVAVAAGHHTHHHPGHTGMATLDHGGAPPGEPQAGHDHSSHCPFCFAPAFALEADPILALVVPELAPVAALPAIECPAARRAANVAAFPRAPPVSRLT